ncbi:MAG: MBL fold metallo-hydrolase [Nannocystis sp.]|nr:MBL fold metallo-hydrolase [Nannocystis sp.]
MGAVDSSTLPLALTFLGATGTVTGSKYLLDTGRVQVLLDCGLFQGFKQLRLRNWQELPISTRALDAVVLTHAHIDHSGYLPVLARAGYRGAVYCTPSTAALCRILLPDAGRLQELDAEYANKKGYSRHHPALPLYTADDATRALELLRPVEFDERFALPGGLHATFTRAGHILGAASVCVEASGSRVLFSGDLGRSEDLLMNPPAPRPDAETVVMESTYGDRLHDQVDPTNALGEAIGRTIARGGTVLIPAFSVGRTQAILVLLHRLRAAGRLPNVPLYVDSPMAIAVTELYARRARDHRLDRATFEPAFAAAEYARETEDSKAIDRREQPSIVISASGMATGGRIVHHLKRFAPQHENMIVLAGYQAAGTRGAALAAGASQLKIHGEYVPVRAEVALLESLSAHADQRELLAWLGSGAPPRQIFLVHGEPAAADTLRVKIREQLGWESVVPDYRDTVHL